MWREVGSETLDEVLDEVIKVIFVFALEHGDWRSNLVFTQIPFTREEELEHGKEHFGKPIEVLVQ